MKAVRNTRVTIRHIFALLFLASGALLLARLLQFDFLLFVPEEPIVWLSAIGSLFGGIHIIYIGIKHKALRAIL